MFYMDNIMSPVESFIYPLRDTSGMSETIKVYETAGYKNMHPEETERFERSVSALEKAGIFIERILIRDVYEVDRDGETFEAVMEGGLAALPIAEYMGAMITDGQYPDDQTLADYLDVPDGVLSVDRVKPSAPNDLPPACMCGNNPNH